MSDRHTQYHPPAAGAELSPQARDSAQVDNSTSRRAVPSKAVLAKAVIATLPAPSDKRSLTVGSAPTPELAPQQHPAVSVPPVPDVEESLLKVVEGGLEARTPSFRARFSTQGFTFVPLRAEQPPSRPVDQDRAESRDQFAFRLERLFRGDRLLWSARRTPEPTAEGARAVFRHEDWLEERYELLNSGVHQTFLIARPPAGHGDILVVGALSTHLAPAIHEAHGAPITFVDRATNASRLSYGSAFAIDAMGLRTAITTRVSGDELVLRLDGRFLEAATYPIEIDPVVEPSSSSGSGGTGSGSTVASPPILRGPTSPVDGLASRITHLTVRAEDPTGSPLAELQVRYEVIEGGGSLRGGTTLTDGLGEVAFDFLFPGDESPTIIRVSVPEFPDSSTLDIVCRAHLPEVIVVGLEDGEYKAPMKGEPGSLLGVLATDPNDPGQMIPGRIQVEAIVDHASVIPMPAINECDGGFAMFRFLVKENADVVLRLQEFPQFRYEGQTVGEVRIPTTAPDVSMGWWAMPWFTGLPILLPFGPWHTLIASGQGQVGCLVADGIRAMEPIDLDLAEVRGVAQSFVAANQGYFSYNLNSATEPDAPGRPMVLLSIIFNDYVLPADTAQVRLIGLPEGSAIHVSVVYGPAEWQEIWEPTGPGYERTGTGVLLDFTKELTGRGAMQGSMQAFHFYSEVAVARAETRVLNAATLAPRHSVPTHSVFNGDWTPATRDPGEEVVLEVRRALSEDHPLTLGMEACMANGWWGFGGEVWGPDAVGHQQVYAPLHKVGVVDGRYAVWRSDPIQATAELFPSGMERPALPTDRQILQTDPRAAVQIYPVMPFPFNPEIMVGDLHEAGWFGLPASGIYFTTAEGELARNVPLFVPDSGFGAGAPIVEPNPLGPPGPVVLHARLDSRGPDAPDLLELQIEIEAFPQYRTATLTETGLDTGVFADSSIEVRVLTAPAADPSQRDTLQVRFLCPSDAVDETLTLTETTAESGIYTNGPTITGYGDAPASKPGLERFFVEERDFERGAPSIVSTLSTSVESSTVTLTRATAGVYRSGPMVLVPEDACCPSGTTLPTGEVPLRTRLGDGRARDVHAVGCDFWARPLPLFLAFYSMIHNSPILGDLGPDARAGNEHRKNVADIVEGRLGLALGGERPGTKAGVLRSLRYGGEFYFDGHPTTAVNSTLPHGVEFGGIDLLPDVIEGSRELMDTAIRPTEVHVPPVRGPQPYSLVIMSCCLSAQSQLGANVFDYSLNATGLAFIQAFRAESYVGWQGTVNDDTSAVFVEFFLRSLDGGASVGFAFDQACARMMDSSNPYKADFEQAEARCLITQWLADNPTTVQASPIYGACLSSGPVIDLRK